MQGFKDTSYRVANSYHDFFCQSHHKIMVYFSSDLRHSNFNFQFLPHSPLHPNLVHAWTLVTKTAVHLVTVPVVLRTAPVMQVATREAAVAQTLMSPAPLDCVLPLATEHVARMGALVSGLTVATVTLLALSSAIVALILKISVQ